MTLDIRGILWIINHYYYISFIHQIIHSFKKLSTSQSRSNTFLLERVNSHIHSPLVGICNHCFTFTIRAFSSMSQPMVSTYSRVTSDAEDLVTFSKSKIM